MSRRKPEWTRHAGDESDTIVAEVSKFLGDNLDNVSTVSATLRHTTSGAEVARTAAVLSSADRTVEVDLGTWLQSTAVAGDDYYVTLTVTTTGADVLTVPERLEDRPVLEIV